MIRVLERILLERPLERIAGARPIVGCPGAMFEIRERTLHPLSLPHGDTVPVAIDAQGRLIAGRTSGDRVVRRYREKSLDGTFPFTLDEIVSLAVCGDRTVVVKKNGEAIGLDERTVPRIDYSFRLNRRFRFVDGTEDRIALSGDESLVCDWKGSVLKHEPVAGRVRLGSRGLWRIGDDLRCGRRIVRPDDLHLREIRDVIAGAEDWVLGEALVRFEV